MSELYLIQGLDGPIFKGPVPSTAQLVCEGCRSSVLIENYAAQNFVCVRIKCFKCGTITQTPGIDDGEILPPKVLVIGTEGKCLLEKQVIISAQMTVTCDPLIVDRQKDLQPKLRPALRREMSLAWLDSVADTYNNVTRGSLAVHAATADRARRQGIFSLEYPLASALGYLRWQVARNKFSLNPRYDLAPLSFIMAFEQFVGAWQHHPRFSEIAQALKGKYAFFHTIVTLAIATYMFTHDNRIGLTLVDRAGVPSPDLYVRVDADRRFHIEVKAPLIMHDLVAKRLNVNDVSQLVEKVLKSASKQINRHRPGILVISMGLADPSLETVFDEGVTTALRNRGHNHRSVAAVVSVFQSIATPRTINAQLVIDQGFFAITPYLNPRFEGDNPVRTETS